MGEQDEQPETRRYEQDEQPETRRAARASPRKVFEEGLWEVAGQLAEISRFARAGRQEARGDHQETRGDIALRSRRYRASARRSETERRSPGGLREIRRETARDRARRSETERDRAKRSETPGLMPQHVPVPHRLPVTLKNELLLQNGWFPIKYHLTAEIWKQ